METGWNQIATMMEIDGEVLVVFKNEQTAEDWKHLFPGYIRFTCFNGYMNALQITERMGRREKGEGRRGRGEGGRISS